ncbi:TolC family protein [Chitinophaga pinensis]|uniref:Outer membrane efflux protein n=1 Tax=Chitinophaga pinensis (strain ATCC 43595 / DSM 2588 / LMG 13176 / NBRC 15968 / NCIMB 11800 / UQM 2034) TaxID=485918 RepID=A0A979H015_CHIPD|nr:TolC family protein [Chitinophaga pinensis]ACU63005.1 outer membrane efflux protein [Chitinophaga pinensis DSM 2588]
MKQYHHLKGYIFTGTLALYLLSAGGSQLKAQDISLDSVISKAQKNNNSLKADALNIDRAQSQTIISRSYLRPEVGFSSAVNHYFQQPLFFGFGDAGTTPADKIGYGRFGGKDQANASLDISVPIYSPLQRSTIEKNKLEETQRRLQYRMKAADVTAAVKQVYLRILVLEKRKQLQQESIERNKRALADARSLFLQGKALLVDTLRAYTSWKNLEPDLLRISYAIDVSKEQLNILMGADPAAHISLADTLQAPENDTLPDEPALFARSLQERPELQLLSLQRDISQKEVATAKNARLPVITGVGQYLLQTQANSFKYYDAYYPSTSFVGAKITLPIYTGGRHNERIKKAQIEQQQASIQYTDATDKLQGQVKQIVANLNETYQRIQTQATVTSTAESSYRLTKYRYERGAATRLELVDAELSLTSARSAYLEAVFDFEAAKIEMERLLGTTH